MQQTKLERQESRRRRIAHQDEIVERLRRLEIIPYATYATPHMLLSLADVELLLSLAERAPKVV